MLNNKLNNRAAAVAGYTVSGVYAVASVANAVNGFPLASVFCGAISGLSGAVTNSATSVDETFDVDAAYAEAQPAEQPAAA